MDCATMDTSYGTTSSDFVTKILELLRSTLGSAATLNVRDVTSVEHVEEGAKDGRAIDERGRQLHVSAISPAFRGLRPLQRHRLVMSSIQGMINSGAIHSVKIETMSDEQAIARANAGRI